MKPALPLLLSLAVGASSLAITGWLWQLEKQTDARSLRASFDTAVRQTTDRIAQRTSSYEQTLRGVQGLFVATERVDRESFEAYVDTLLAGTDITGLQAIAYGPLLPGEQGPAHAAMQRASGLVSYTIHPPGRRDAYVPITYIAPRVGRNTTALGFDVLQDPDRRAALLKARDSGNVAITGRLRLVTEPDDQETQYGFLLALPLYAKGQPVDSIEARRKNLEGWVWAGVRMRDLMSSLYGESMPGLQVRIDDGSQPGSDTEMFRSSATDDTTPARFQVQEYVSVAGRTWTLSVRTLPAFEQRHRRDSTRIILWAGAGLSLLLTLLTYLLTTGRARAYAVAHAMTRELRASEERYRRIVETANEGIWLIDADKRIAFVNPKMLRMLACDASDMLNRPLLDFIHEQDRPIALADIERHEAAPREPHDLRYRRPDGSDLWVAVSVATIVDANGLPVGALGMVTDITERKQADAKRGLLESQLRESQKMEAIGTLAGGIAHDFNNILAAILGNAALAREQVAAGSQAHNSLEQIELAGVRGRSLVQKILAFSRMQPHVLVSQPLRPLVEQSVALLRATLPASVDLSLRLADETLLVGADATQVQQVLINLCTNAWHALQGNAGCITIGLDAADLRADTARGLGEAAPGRYAHLWVRDTGSGMSEATRARVFEPFFTTKPVGQGTGLGLSVVHGIVSAHQGVITVDSKPGRGSTFHLFFPLVQALASPPDAPSAAPHTQGRGQHVLYVDDDPAMLLLVESLLQRAGYRVTALERPREAIDRVQAKPDEFDLVVTDYNMPELTGMDLALAIARIRPELPLVISSGYVSDEMREKAQGAGVRGLIQKEYTLEQLAEVVHSVLAKATPLPG